METKFDGLYDFFQSSINLTVANYCLFHQHHDWIKTRPANIKCGFCSWDSQGSMDCKHGGILTEFKANSSPVAISLLKRRLLNTKDPSKEHLFQQGRLLFSFNYPKLTLHRSAKKTQAPLRQERKDNACI